MLPQVENIFGVNQNGSIPRAHWFQDGAPGHRLNAVHDCLHNNNNNNNTYRAPYNKFSKRFTYINLKVHYIQI